MCMDIVKDCKNLEQSYGQICVLCNKCGRFDKKILTKDQRIAELEKYIKGKEIFLSNENITIFAKTFEDYEEIMLREENAVKEFAEELKKKIENDTYILTNLNIDETYCGNKVTKQELFEFIIFDLLKEKGIE